MQIVFVLLRAYNIIEGVTTNKQLAEDWQQSAEFRTFEEWTIGEYDSSIRARLESRKSE